MILHISLMRRNVNRNVYNAGKCKRYSLRVVRACVCVPAPQTHQNDQAADNCVCR